MNVVTAVGGSATYQLSRAILVYAARDHGLHLSSDDAHTFATVHPVLHRYDGKGPPKLGVGTLCTTAFLQELAAGLGSNLRPEVLGPDVVCRTPQVIGWWTPAQTRPLFFYEKSSLAPISGKHFPLPALVWRIVGGELYVRALRDNIRPSADTRLFRAPFWNTNQAGLVCQGSMRRPETITAATTAEWVDGFFAAQFTHVLDQFGGKGATQHEGGIEGLWRSLAGSRRSRKRFPLETLVPAKETLQQFLERGRNAQN